MKAIKFIASLFVSATVLSSAIAGNAPKKAADALAVDTKGSKIHWLAKKVTGQHEGFISISNGSLYRDWETDRKSTRLNSSHLKLSRMPSSA